MTPLADLLAAIRSGGSTTTTTMVFTVLAQLLIAAIVWAVADWVWFTPKKLERHLRQQGFTGNPYRLYYGDLKDGDKLIRDALSKPMESFSADVTARVRPLLHHTVKSYGKNSFFWEGPVPVVSICEPELMREVMNRYEDFHKAKTNPIVTLLAGGVLRYEGEKWARHRKLINPAFYMEKLKLMLPSFYASAMEMVKKWEAMLPEPETEQELDVHPYLATMSSDVISRAAFGSSYEEGRRIFQLLRAQIVLTGSITRSVYFPGLRFIPTKLNRRFWGMNKEVKSLVLGIIQKRMKETTSNNIKQDDLLGLLLSSSNSDNNLDADNNTSQYKQRVTMTTDELIEECKLFYIAGQETTSTLLTWTMILLSKHQQWQSKARDEVLSTFGHKKPNFEDLNHLRIMTMIFHEVLRLYTLVPEIRRSVIKHNTKLGHLSLPTGVVITLPAVIAHHDREQWGDDVHEFYPERFSEGISKASKKRGAAYLPFGWGPRICVGSNFALLEAKLALSMILQRFEFQLSSRYTHAPVSSGIVIPEFGAPLILRRLSVELDTY